jgi:hypothetical protein
MTTAWQMANGKSQMGKWWGTFAIFLLPFSMPYAVQADEAAVLKQVNLLNRVPEADLTEKTDPGFSILRTLYDQDGPDFLLLRNLLGKAEVRAHLNPSTRCVLAGVISQRWDTFALSGNLYLSGLQSKNPDLRDKASKKLVCFIRPQHIPALIELLKVPGPNVLAYEILQEVTGQRMDPNVKVWQKWWVKRGVKMDLVGHLINATRIQLKGSTIHPFDEARFWYVPEGVEDAQTPYNRRTEHEKDSISEWNSWVGNDVKRYVDEWTDVKGVMDRIMHQPDPRVNVYLETLVSDPGYGDYASVVLAWRSSRTSLPVIAAVVRTQPTVGRELARGSLGDRKALVDLLRILEDHQEQPLSYNIMDDDARELLPLLRTVGAVPAEQAFELLCHRNFEFNSAYTPKAKKKATKAARDWLNANAEHLALDRRRGYFVVPSSK